MKSPPECPWEIITEPRLVAESGVSLIIVVPVSCSLLLSLTQLAAARVTVTWPGDCVRSAITGTQLLPTGPPPGYIYHLQPTTLVSCLQTLVLE